GEREQRGDLRRRLGAFGGPARRLADIDERQLCLAAGLVVQLGEERRLLRTSDHAFASGKRRAKSLDLLAAELGVNRDRRSRLQRSRERLGIERHGAVAVAELEGLVVERHLTRRSRPSGSLRWTVIPPSPAAPRVRWEARGPPSGCRSAREVARPPCAQASARRLRRGRGFALDSRRATPPPGSDRPCCSRRYIRRARPSG